MSLVKGSSFLPHENISFQRKKIKVRQKYQIHKAVPLQTGSNVFRPTKHFKSQTLFFRVLGTQTS